MVTLQKLKIFTVVVERGSFNRAASDMLMSQSAVSQHIQDLERSLGVSLFDRSPQGVLVTQAGEVLYDYAKQIHHLLAEAESKIVQIDQLQNRQLIISATPGVSVYLLPPLLRRFQNTYPNINVSMQTVLTPTVIQGVLHHRYSLGFLEGDHDELEQVEIGQIDLQEIEYFVMVGSHHPWAERDMVLLEELPTQPFLIRQPDSRTRRWIEKTLAERSVALHITAELDSPGTIKYALLSDMGIAILPEYAVTRERQHGDIHMIRIDGLDLKRPFKLVWDKRQPFDPIQRSFLNLLRDTCPQINILL